MAVLRTAWAKRDTWMAVLGTAWAEGDTEWLSLGMHGPRETPGWLSSGLHLLRGTARQLSLELLGLVPSCSSCSACSSRAHIQAFWMRGDPENPLLFLRVKADRLVLTVSSHDKDC